jgi:hypothetical protein
MINKLQKQIYTILKFHYFTNFTHKILIIFLISNIILITGGMMFSNTNKNKTKQMEERITYPNSPITNKNVYKYDNSGNIIEVIYHKIKDTKIIGTAMDKYIYDINNRLSEQHKKQSDEKIIFLNKFKYNEKGLKIETITTEPDGIEVFRSTFKYDENSHLIEVCDYPNSNENTITIFKNNSQGNPINDETKSVHNNLIIQKSTYNYNIKGKLIEKITFDTPFNEKNGRKIIYEYDNNSHLIKKLSYNIINGKDLLILTAEYIYQFY